MCNDTKDMVFVKAIHSNVMLSSVCLVEGQCYPTTMTPEIETLRAMNKVKVFSSREEATDYNHTRPPGRVYTQLVPSVRRSHPPNSADPIENAVYVMALVPNVKLSHLLLIEGQYCLSAMTPAIAKAEKMHTVKTFSSEKEAADYKFMPLSEKAIASIASFSLKPELPKDIDSLPEREKAKLLREYEQNIRAWEANQNEALVTPFGDPTPRALELERKMNADDEVQGNDQPVQ